MADEKKHSLTDEERQRRRELMRERRRKRVMRNRIILGSICGLVLLLIGFGVVRAVGSKSTRSAGSDESAGNNTVNVSVTSDVSDAEDIAQGMNEALQAVAISAEAVHTITPTDISVTFTGDFILGTDEYFDYSTSMNAYYDENGADYFLKNVEEIFQKDDLTIINFEGTLTEETDRIGNQFAFKAPPEYIDIIRDKSIEAANVANNHSHDYGEKSFTDTIEALDSNGILHFGYEDVAVTEVNGVKVGIFGIYELDEYGGVAPQVTERIQELKEQNCDFIIAVFHWGNELESFPDQYQVDLGHQAIDEGADVVVGHHPHVLQGIEYYKDKIIAYSLGNFCFGGNSHPTEMDTMIFQVKFSLNEQAEVTDQEIRIIPCLVSTTWEYNDYVPTVLTGEDADYVINKLDTRSQEIAYYYGAETVYNSSTDGEIGI